VFIDDDDSFSDGQIAGITIGALGGVALIYGVVVYLSMKKGALLA